MFSIYLPEGKIQIIDTVSQTKLNTIKNIKFGISFKKNVYRVLGVTPRVLSIETKF